MVAWGEGDGGGRGDKKKQINNGGGRLCSRPIAQRQLTELGAGIWDQGLGATWRESTNTPVKWELGTLTPWGCVE